MTLEGLYFIAQIAAALAVVASLVFVGLQIKTNTRAQYVTSFSDRLNIMRDLETSIMQSPELRDCLVRGAMDYAALSEQDKLAYGSYMTLQMGYLASAQLHWDAGAIQRFRWEGSQRNFARQFRKFNAGPWWEAEKPKLAPGMAQMVEDALAALEAFERPAKENLDVV